MSNRELRLMQLHDTVCLIDGQKHGKNLYLQFLSDDAEKVQRFRQVCYLTLNKQTAWFHQGNAENWQMFEFWSDKQELILSDAETVAEKMGLPFEL